MFTKSVDKVFCMWYHIKAVADDSKRTLKTEHQSEIKADVRVNDVSR